MYGEPREDVDHWAMMYYRHKTTPVGYIRRPVPRWDKTGIFRFFTLPEAGEDPVEDWRTGMRRGVEREIEEMMYKYDLMGIPYPWLDIDESVPEEVDPYAGPAGAARYSYERAIAWSELTGEPLPWEVEEEEEAVDFGVSDDPMEALMILGGFDIGNLISSDVEEDFMSSSGSYDESSVEFE